MGTVLSSNMCNVRIAFTTFEGDWEDVSLEQLGFDFEHRGGTKAEARVIKAFLEERGRGQLEVWMDDYQIFRFCLKKHHIYRKDSCVSTSEAMHWLYDVKGLIRDNTDGK